MSEEGYRLEVDVSDLPLPISSATATIWGVPADKGHDPERGQKALAGGPPLPSESPAGVPDDARIL